MNDFIPVNTPLFIGNEKKYLNECIDTGWISSEGSFIKKFEDQFSEYCTRKHGIAVSSGSAALDIAIKAIGIQDGDEVIVPTFTIISPVLSIIKAGGIPIFVDSEAYTWNMNLEHVEALITEKTKAILVVHIYGLPVDMEKVMHLAAKYKIKVVEDAAEMHGQTVNERKCGSFGDISIFSFYANKTISTGEGGMLLCNDDELAEASRKYRNLSFDPNYPRFVHFEKGWNYRMTNMQAALGLAQLEQIEKLVEKKRLIGDIYQNELSFLKNYGYHLPLTSTSFAKNIYWVFGLVAPTEKEKEKIVDHLNKNQIGTRPFFWCMHEQPVLTSAELKTKSSYPVAERLARCGFYLPSGLGLTLDDLRRIVNSIKTMYA